MACPYTNFLYHIVFRTKNRELLLDDTFQERLYNYVGGIIRAKKGILLSIGGMQDHLDLLVKLKPIESVSKTIGELKGNSSKWINDERPCRMHFNWQAG